MTATSIQYNTNQRPKESDRNAGRIVVHTVGNETGLIRLDIPLPQLATADEVRRKVQLAIPGEAPLSPTSVVAVDDHFVISFYSSDIANAGHLPADAIVTWETPGPTHHTQHVRITAAENVERAEGSQAVRMPGGEPTIVYPFAVGILVVLAIFLAGLVIFALLI